MMKLHLLGLAVVSAVAFGKTLTVAPGKTIQSALDQARTGDTVEVSPGIYRESLVVESPGIKLFGKPDKGEWPILEGDGKKNDGVIASGSNFEMAYFKVRNYKGNGVMTQGADDVFLHHLEIKDTGIYGIYPTRGSRIRVEDTISSGIADAAIYVGMCVGAEVRRNETFENVAGIEIENSHHVIVEDNNVHDNAGGILVFTLPGLPIKSGENTIVRNNRVENNNFKNFGAEGSIVGDVPTGSGMILLAADKVTIENNIIRGNKTGGIIFTDMEYIASSTTPDKGVDPQFDHNQVLDNTFENNGGSPALKARVLLAALHFTLKGGDVLVHGKGRGNCLAPSVKGKVLGAEKFSKCPSGATTKSITTVLTMKPVVPVTAGFVTDAKPGQRHFEAVCAGCHGMGIRLIGPPLQEIQKKYAGNPDGIAAFARTPYKIRSGYPAMPAQSHLSPEKLRAVAEYVLTLK